MEFDPEPAVEVAAEAELDVVAALEELPVLLVPLAVASVAAMREFRSA